MQKEVRILQQHLDSEIQQGVEQRRRIEELENRLLLLEDRLETARVQQDKTKAPELPVVKLSPQKKPPKEAAPGPSSEVASGPVIYEGEAANENRPPLVLSSSDALRLPVVAVPEAPPATSPLSLYRQGHEALASGRIEEAEDAFERFLKMHPKHDYSDNALYWLGECQYVRKNYQLALESYRAVVDRYPMGNKVPDAMLKIAYSYLALGQSDAGQKTLAELVGTYPLSEAAKLAQAKLSEGGK